MKTQQRLIAQVKQFLSQNHNISISIPTLHNLLDSKVNLKISPPTITPAIIKQHSNIVRSSQNSSKLNSYQNNEDGQNRYRLMIVYIEELLSSSSLDLSAIESFMIVFNTTINNDIEMMQRNEIIRSNSFKMKQKLLFKIQEISKKTQVLTATSEKIHDKSEIISFIAIDIKNYLLSMKLVEDQYEAVRTVQIHTPMKIDKIYQFQYSSQQDYHDHYQPLLQVLVRLRANMNNLEQSVKNSDRISMPLKSVNLLATCKNLLTQLQPFLVTNHCAFNRLIFHVVTQQGQNMKLISGFYKHYLQFVKSLVYNTFKCVYLGHVFKPHYYDLTQKINKQRNNVTQLVLRINMNIKHEKYAQTQRRITTLQNNLSEIDKKITNMKKIICFGKSSIMQLYLEQKICKKLNLLLKKRQQVRQLQSQLSQSKRYLVDVKNLIKQVDELPRLKSQVQKHAEVIGKDVSKSTKSNLMLQGNVNTSVEQRRQKIFKNDFTTIQQKYLIISTLQKSINSNQRLCKQQRIKSEYFPKLIDNIKTYKQELSNLQIKLLNSYQQLLQINQQKQAQAEKQCQKTMKQVGNYLTNQQPEQGAALSTMGGQILNEDEHSHRVKQLLGKVDKAQYLTKNGIKKVKSPSKSDQLKKLQMQRKFLQWLLTMFQGSMDQNILQSIIDKMQFNEQSQSEVKKNISKVNQLLTQVQKHNKALLKIVKQIQFRNINQQQEKDKEKQKEKSMTKSMVNTKPKLVTDQQQKQTQNNIYNKIYKISKQRLALYEMIQIIYTQCLSVYIDLKLTPAKGSKKPEHHDIKQEGVKVFDRKLFDYCLLCYQCLNKISVLTKQLNDSNIKTKTKNYLNDDILEPFSNRLGNYLMLSQKQALNVTLRLEKSIEIEKNYKNLLKKWEEAASSSYANAKQQNAQSYLIRLRQRCQQLVDLNKQIQQIEQLNKNQVKVHNIQQMNKIFKQCQEYIIISQQVLQTEPANFDKICNQIKFKNQKLNTIANYMRKLQV